jgi:hypothetical protein
MPRLPSRTLDAIRLTNALLLFDEFARDAAALGADKVGALNAAFAQRVKIAPSQWSRFKTGRDHIGKKLADQIAVLMHKPPGWLDVDRAGVAAIKQATADSAPADERERMAVALFLAAFRADPERVALQVLGVLAEQIAPPGG